MSNLTAPIKSTPGVNPNVPAVPQPLADPGSLVNAVQALKQGMDSLAGARGNQLGRAVTFNDLLRLQLTSPVAVTSPGGASDLTTTPIAAAIGPLNTAIKDEVTRAEAAEAGLSSSITAETTRAEAAEAAISAGLPSLPLSVADGGTGTGTAGGAALDNIAGFSATGFLERTGAGAYTFVAASSLATTTALSAETTRAEAAEGTLTTNLASEVTRATTAEALYAPARQP